MDNIIIEGDKLYKDYITLMGLDKQYLELEGLPDYLISEKYKINHKLSFISEYGIFNDTENLKTL